MRPKERRDSGQNDLFCARLDQIVDLGHPLAKLAGSVDWGFLEEQFGAVYSDKAGHPPLPTRLMAGLAILKHMHDLSDEALCERWIENPYFQLFCGEEFFQHQPPFDRSSLTRWRQRMGEEKLVALVQESLNVATRAGAAKPSDFSKVIVDTTVQPKAIAFPTDAKLMHRARERLVRLAKQHGVRLRQSYEHQARHAAPILDRLICEVRVTDPRHPLFGQQFATLPERSSRGAGFVVITLADGRRRSIRRAATDLGGTAAMAAESRSALPRVSARTILPLAHHLARTFASSSKEEVIRDDDPCLSPSRSVPGVDQAADHPASDLVGPRRPDAGPSGAGSCRADASNDVRDLCDGGAPPC
jgi:hypothetical protein